MSLQFLSGGGSSSALGPQWTPIPRSPLAPFPSPVTYDHVLPVAPPAARDLRYYRGNFCGLHFADAPIVPGCNAARPETVMSCLLDNYPRAFQDRYLAGYAERGFTHLQRSLGHALYYGNSFESYAALSARARSTFGLYCDHWFLNAGEGETFAFKQKGQDAAYWRALLTPYIARLRGEGLIDTACVGWQLDQILEPGNTTLGVIALLAELLPSTIPLSTHWVNEAGAWWKDGGETWTDRYGSLFVHDRFTFWQACAPYLDGLYYQGDTHTARTNPKLFQDRMKDTLDPMSGPTGKGYFGQSVRSGTPRPFALVAWEITGQEQFNVFDPGNPPTTPPTGGCSEDEGDLDGFLATCATSFNGLGTAGYGNGARRPDGSAL